MNKTMITNIDGLIKALDLCDGDYCYLDIMKSVNIPEREFERYYKWNDHRYTRNQLIRTKKYELVLICWEKGQQSPIHDYNAHEAWIHPVRGQLREERFLVDKQTGQLEKVSSVLLGTEEFSYMCKGVEIHRYSNSYESRSVSLHLYSNPIDHWTVYSADGGATEEKQVWWDSINETEMISS